MCNVMYAPWISSSRFQNFYRTILGYWGRLHDQFSFIGSFIGLKGSIPQAYKELDCYSYNL